MNDEHEDPGCEVLIRRVAARQRQLWVDHPSAGALDEYLEGTLAAPQHDALQEHLVRCPHCTQALLERSGPKMQPGRSGEADPELRATEMDDDFRAIWQQLRCAPVPDRQPAENGEDLDLDAAMVQPASPARWRSPLYRIAAMFLLAASAVLLVWGLSQRSTIISLGQPSANVEIIDLIPVAERGVRGAQARATEISSGAPAFLLLLNLAHPPGHGELEAEIRAAAEPGGEVTRVRGLRPTDAGSFSLLVPAGLLSPGEYELRLTAADGDPDLPVAEYRFRVDSG